MIYPYKKAHNGICSYRPTHILSIGVVDLMCNNSTYSLSARNFARILSHSAPDKDMRLLTNIISWPNLSLELLDKYDAVVITGAEPTAKFIGDDVHYARVAALSEYLLQRNIPTIFSCLSAHISLHHTYGLSRYNLDKKVSSVFTHDCAGLDQSLLAKEKSLDDAITFPHSRWNYIPTRQLHGQGLHCAITEDGTWGLALDERGNIFLQGHPEYAGDTLHREYHRDMLRCLLAASDGPDRHDGRICTAGNDMKHKPLIVSAPYPREDHSLPWLESCKHIFHSWLKMCLPAKIVLKAR